MSNTTKAILFVLLATIFSDIGAMLTKYVFLKDFSVSQVIFMRSFLRTIPLFFLIKSMKYFSFKTKIGSSHLMRCILGAATAFLLTYGTQFVSIAESTVIGYMTPIFFTICCALCFNEEITYSKALVIMVSFLGIIVSLNISPSEFKLAGLLILLSSIFSAIHRIYIKKVSQIDDPILGNIFLNCFLMLLTCSSLFFGNWTSLKMNYVPILLAGGFISFLTQYLSAKALRICDGSILAPIDYLSFVTVIILEYLFKDVVPNIYIIMGAIMIVGANLYHFYKEREVRESI